MYALFDSLARMFTQVTGSPPRGAAVSDEAAGEAMAALTADVSGRLDMEIDPLRVPPVYLDFWRRFGGEKKLTNKTGTLYPPGRLRTTLSHLIFAVHQHSGLAFGVDHIMLEDDDPSTMYVEVAALEEEEDDDEGDDPWEDFTATLSEGLIELAADNLLNSLRHQSSFDDCDTEQFRSLLASLESVYGEDASAVTAPTLVYFGPGVLVNYEHAANSVLIGFDTAKRMAAFRKRYSEAG